MLQNELTFVVCYQSLLNFYQNFLEAYLRVISVMEVCERFGIAIQRQIIY